MFYTEAYLRDKGEVDRVGVLSMDGTQAKVACDGTEYPAEYNKETGMFYVNNITEQDDIPVEQG